MPPAALLRRSRRLAALCLVGAWPAAACASYLDDIGYRALATELGAALPRGASVAVVQVEAGVSTTGERAHDAPAGEAAGAPRYRPDPSGSGANRFDHVTFHDRSGALEPQYSGHATQIALLIAGSASMTPAIARIDNYESTDWLASVLFNHGLGYAPPRPQVDTGMLANHSWVGAPAAAAAAADVLTRLDYLVDRANYVQVVGALNPRSTLLATSYNAIAVGCTAKPFAGTSQPLDDFYVAGRVIPWLTAPAPTVSSATAMVTSAVALLIDSVAGHALPAAGIRALLAAGAERRTHNGAPGDIVDWAGSGANGLDPRYGAGQLDVRQAYHLLHAPSPTQGYAWHDAPAVAPAGGVLARIEVQPGEHDATLIASLAWNARVDAADGPFQPVRSRAHLEFALRALDAQGERDVLRRASVIDNSQHLLVPVARGARYVLEVSRGAGDAAPLPGFAVAWRLAPR